MIHYAQIKIKERIGYRRRLDNPNSHKRMLWSLFEDYNLPHNSGGWLFRFDQDKIKKDFLFFVMSKFKPNPDRLLGDGIEIEIGSVSRDIFKTGTRFGFKTRVNAVVKEGSSGKRIPMDIANIPVWVKNRFSGAAKCNCIVENTSIQTSFKNRQLISHFFADVRGGLEVIDNASFVEILENGIGHSKRYGFGLIALSKVK